MWVLTLGYAGAPHDSTAPGAHIDLGMAPNTGMYFFYLHVSLNHASVEWRTAVNYIILQKLM